MSNKDWMGFVNLAGDIHQLVKLGEILNKTNSQVLIPQCKDIQSFY